MQRRLQSISSISPTTPRSGLLASWIYRWKNLRRLHNLNKNANWQGADSIWTQVCLSTKPDQFAALCWHYQLKTPNMKLKNQDKENTEECMLLLVEKVILMMVIQEPQGKCMCVSVCTGILKKINSKKRELVPDCQQNSTHLYIRYHCFPHLEWASGPHPG